MQVSQVLPRVGPVETPLGPRPGQAPGQGIVGGVLNTLSAPPPLLAPNPANAALLLNGTSSESFGLPSLLSSLLNTQEFLELSSKLQQGISTLQSLSSSSQSAEGLVELRALRRITSGEDPLYNSFIDTPLPLSSLESAPLDSILKRLVAIETVSTLSPQSSVSPNTMLGEILAAGNLPATAPAEPRANQQTPQTQNLLYQQAAQTGTTANSSAAQNSRGERFRYQEHHYQQQSSASSSSPKVLRTLLRGLTALLRKFY